MQLITIIAISSIFVWLLIPIRQFRTRFFLFFLVLGLLDLIVILLRLVLQFNFEITYLFGSALLLYPALITIKKKIRLALCLAIFLVSLFTVFYSINNSNLVQITIHLIILIYFLKILVVYYSENRNLLLFHLFLFAYEFTLLLKFFVAYHELEIGPAYHYLTTGLQVFIGTFFLFFNELNSPKISI